MHDIQPGTFYNWISRFRKRGITIPESSDNGTVVERPMQEVVRLELVPEQEAVPVNAEYNARILANKETEAAPAFEIQTANATIRFYNGTDSGLIETVTIARQQAENDKLKSELAWFRQKFFCSSSERRTCDVAG